MPAAIIEAAVRGAATSLIERPKASLMGFSMMLGAMALLAFSYTLTARPGQHRAARQRRPHRAKAQGRTITSEPSTRQRTADATVAPEVIQAVREDAAMEEPLDEEAVEQAKLQDCSKKSKKKSKTGRASAAGDAPSEVPPAAAP